MRTLASQTSQGSSKMLFHSNTSSQVDLRPHGREDTASVEKLEEIENQFPF